MIAGEPDFTVSIKAWDKVKERLKNGKQEKESRQEAKISLEYIISKLGIVA